MRENRVYLIRIQSRLDSSIVNSPLGLLTVTFDEFCICWTFGIHQRLGTMAIWSTTWIGDVKYRRGHLQHQIWGQWIISCGASWGTIWIKSQIFSIKAKCLTSRLIYKKSMCPSIFQKLCHSVCFFFDYNFVYISPPQ